MTMKMAAFGSTICALTGALLFAAACSSPESKETPGGPVSTCEPVKVDRFKELAIVEDSVTNDARARNTDAGPWSFRHAIENAMPTGADSSVFVTDWLQDWSALKDFNGYKLDRESRAAEMDGRIICPWLKSTPANACDDSCGTCAGRKLDLAKAPFRLIAIINRMDLRERPDRAAASGEGRLIFVLTNGPADDPKSVPLPMSVIFEYGLPESLSTKQWAEAWHQLGTYPDHGEPFKAALEGITDRFTARNASPSRPNGSALAQVRTNESALNWIWQLREFHIDSVGELRLTTLKNNPAESFNGTDALRDLVLKNADLLKADKLVVPPNMLSASADQLMFRWNIPGADEATRKAFAQTTCSGCHSSENPTKDTAFQVSPFRSGTDKLSLFMNDPSRPGADELSKREQSMNVALCAQ